MKNKIFKLIELIIAVSLVSCNEPETVVTNIVHPDGSIDRIIEMRSTNEKVDERFVPSDLQVPYDSTWTVKDSCGVDGKGDSIWIRRAVKLFRNVDEINKEYLGDKGANKKFSRTVDFTEKFRWFNTLYRFSEKIDKIILNGYPVKDYLNPEELKYFYSPENVKYRKENGPDSLKFRSLSDSVNRKVEKWTTKNLVSEWISEFSKLIQDKEGSQLVITSLKSREDEFVKLVDLNDEKLDSLWSNGIILKEFIGEADAHRFKTEADTAIEYVAKNLFVNFNDYSVSIVMPGKVIGTNGYIDSNKVMMWPVKSDYFFSEQYEMWAESKLPNKWAWVVSGFFLIFVLTGVTLRIIKKG